MMRMKKYVLKNIEMNYLKMILHKNVTLKNLHNEKYGRILADVYYDELHINEWLITNRMAVKYEGGTKINLM
jgi:endonuclease YncB( thermonuclease family)